MEIIYFLDAQEAGSQVEQPASGPVGLCTHFVAMPVSSKDTRFKAH
jgi:hypothetical protein